MQQRYYDSIAGRFLSVDPVVTDANTGTSFNRYDYANNNPYKYIDPDGRASSCTGSHLKCDGGGIAGSRSGGVYGALDSVPARASAGALAPAAPSVGATAGSGAVAGPGLLGPMSRGLGALGLLTYSGDAGRDSDKMTLYRAVSTAELTNIRLTGTFNPAPQGSEMKQFWTSPANARAFSAAANVMMNANEYRHVVSVAVSMGTFSMGVPGSDPIGGVQLPYVTYSGATLVPLNQDAIANGIRVVK
jgi:uncharacterized protein RhaS with RHS repeats